MTVNNVCGVWIDVANGRLLFAVVSARTSSLLRIISAPAAGVRVMERCSLVRCGLSVDYLDEPSTDAVQPPTVAGVTA